MKTFSLSNAATPRSSLSIGQAPGGEIRFRNGAKSTTTNTAAFARVNLSTIRSGPVKAKLRFDVLQIVENQPLRNVLIRLGERGAVVGEEALDEGSILKNARKEQVTDGGNRRRIEERADEFEEVRIFRGDKETY
jgi:hypothetical protein